MCRVILILSTSLDKEVADIDGAKITITDDANDVDCTKNTIGDNCNKKIKFYYIKLIRYSTRFCLQFYWHDKLSEDKR